MTKKRNRKRRLSNNEQLREIYDATELSAEDARGRMEQFGTALGVSWYTVKGWFRPVENGSHRNVPAPVLKLAKALQKTGELRAWDRRSRPAA